MSSPTFADLGVSRPVAAVLAKRGINEPFAIQRLVIGDVLAGRDVLAKSPTGSGKTLAFALPMIERIEPGRGPAALVLAPTRELAAQIVEQSQPLAGCTASRSPRSTAASASRSRSVRASARTSSWPRPAASRT
jgi:superfamily II DNA/RNA helicase